MKKCIFCGNKPEKKTKEHVIPQWLIEMTGDPNRTVLIGKHEGKEIKFSWKSFTFPACNECNFKYSKLESRVKGVIENILNRSMVTNENVNDLLDWLDKVRVGLWLGSIQLKKASDFNPNFHISQRIGISDRVCVLYYTNNAKKGISFTGTDFNAFRYQPSCFSLFINDICLFNMSKEYLLGRRLGFPFPSEMKLRPVDSLIEIDDYIPGTSRVMRPVIKKDIVSNGIGFYQCILKAVEGGVPDELKSSYYLENMTNNISKIWYENSFSHEVGFINDNVELCVPASFVSPITPNIMALQTLKFQNYSIDELLPSLSLYDKVEQKQIKMFFKSLRRDNDDFIKIIEKDINYKRKL